MAKNDELKVGRISIIYILMNLVNKGMGIITIPVFTRLLTTSEMGIATTWISWMTILSPITSLSLASGSLYIAMNEFQNKRSEYQSSILTLSTLSSVSCLILYILFHKKLNELFTLSTPLMLFMFIYLIFYPAMDVWMIRQRYEYNIKKLAVVTIASNVISSIIAVIIVLLFRDTSINLGSLRVYGTYAIMGGFALFFYVQILLNGKVYFNKKFWKFGLSVSVPLIFHTLAKNLLDVSDRSMISIYCGKDAVGIYGTIYSISTLSLIVWTAINNAFVPYLYDKLADNKESSEKDISNISNLIIMIYAIACIGLTAVAPEIVKLLTPAQYYEAVYIIPALAAGVFLTCVYNLFANVILFHKKSIGVMVSTIIACVINIFLNAIFIPRLGYIAASYTTLVAYIVLAITQGIVLHKVHKRPLYNMKMITFLSTVVILICLLFNLLYKNTAIRYIIIVIIAVVSLVNYKKVILLLKKIKSNI